MSERTTRMKFEYPSLEAESWYAVFVELVETMDSDLFALHEHANAVLYGGGTVSWDLGTEMLSWTDTIFLAMPTTGVRHQMDAGSVQVLDGFFVLTDATPGAQEVETLVPYAFQRADIDSAVKVIAFRDGGEIKFASGITLGDGDSHGGVTM